MQSGLIGCNGKNKPGSNIDRQPHNRLHGGNCRAMAYFQATAVPLAGNKEIKKMLPSWKALPRRGASQRTAPLQGKGSRQRWAPPPNKATHVDLLNDFKMYFFSEVICCSVSSAFSKYIAHLWWWTIITREEREKEPSFSNVLGSPPSSMGESWGYGDFQGWSVCEKNV